MKFNDFSARLLPFALILAATLCKTSSHAADPIKVPGAEVDSSGKVLLLKLDSATAKAGKVLMPRLCAPLRSIEWKGQPDLPLKFVPEPNEWVFSWKKTPEDATIKIVFDTSPLLPPDCPVASPAGDSSVMLHAYQAATFGEKLRFEPQWYKNTVGYWAVASDYATWKLSIGEPGTYTVAALQGCGKGQGGSEAKITIHQNDNVESELAFKTIDTGHFQNFRWNHLGSVKISKAGDFELKLEATKIQKVALFDVRMIHLVRQAKPQD